MDVRCERCKTEYEFDDARITEAGVTVKCTTCGHIFKVKKKALVVTVPVKAEDASAQDAPPASSAAPPPSTSAAEKPREWKVRQANGNLFTFKELTTLQKWIVERKVSRDDEISLTGESWKRLGNIAELASFFQVVEEAQKVQQLQAIQTQAMLNPMLTPSGGNPLPQIPGNGSAPPPAATAAPAPSSLPMVGAAPTPPAPAPQPSAPPAPALTASANPPPAPRERVMNAARTSAPEPRFVAPGADDHDDVAAAGLKKSGGGGKWLVVLLVLALLGAGGYFGWQHGYLQPYLQPLLAKVFPDQFPPADVQPPVEPATPPEAVQAPPVEQPAEPVVAAVEDAGVQTLDAGVTAAAPEAQDAGAPQVVEAPKQPALDVRPATAVVEKVEAKRNFDYWLAQGDRLREREKFLAALDAYGKAADLKPDRAEAYAGRGLALLDLGRRPQAEASFQEALKLNPRYAVAVMGLAETYRQMGNKAEAIQFYEKYLEILPNGPEAAVAKSAIARLKE